MILTKLNESLLIIPNFFHSIFAKLQEIFEFSAENLGHWLSVAKPYLLAGLGVVLLCLFCFCFLPAIISCILWIVAIIWSLIVVIFLFLLSLIRGLFMFLWSLIRGFFVGLKTVFDACFSCCRGTARMMKAPGMGGIVIIERAVFEADARAYFIGLRAAKPLLG